MYGTPEEISEAHKPSAGEHYVLSRPRVSPRPRAPWPGSRRHAELENGVSVGRSLIEVKKSLELGLTPNQACRPYFGAIVRLWGRVGRPEMPPAAWADPELVRFPGLTRGWIAHLHLGPAALAPDLERRHSRAFYNFVRDARGSPGRRPVEPVRTVESIVAG
jgi:hypothetical protein